jgi:hypothetical protein
MFEFSQRYHIKVFRRNLRNRGVNIYDFHFFNISTNYALKGPFCDL